jgi:solute carrier family 25 citrate transporter 1
MAGFFSAALEISIVWPSEYAKVQMQLNRGNAGFRIMPHLLEQGFGIYRGLTPLLIGAPIQGFLRFGSLDFFNNLLRDPETGKVGRASGLLAGMCAGVLESFIVVTPMETVKTRLIDSGKGLLDGIRYVVAKDGVRGLYKGLLPTMAKSSSNQVLRFGIFNEYKRWVIGNRPITELHSGEALAGGMIAGCLGACCNTPFDTVKTRMQGLEAGRYSGLFNCAVTMIKEEGILSLWKGLGPRLMRVVPGQGIIFCSYESISNALMKVI